MKIEFFNWFPKKDPEEVISGRFWTFDLLPSISVMNNYKADYHITLGWLFWQLLITIRK